MKLAVIADDLTGANDTGVQFAKQGLNTTVLFSDTTVLSTHLREDVLVFNSDSRALRAEEAYQVVVDISTQLNQLAVSNVFKKIDSTMRGNIGQEIDAVMDAYHHKMAFVVPAFPKNKRVTINGDLLVDGVLLEETEIALDPVTPVKQSYLPKLVQEQSKREVELISIWDVRKGTSHLSQKMNALSTGENSKIIIVDATNDEELKTIVEAADHLSEPFLWVGSAGIAYHLFDIEQCDEPSDKTPSGERLPVLVVAGSVNPIIDRQIGVLKEKNTVEEIVISPEEFFYEDRRKREMDRIIEAGQALLGNGDLVITTNRERKTINRVKEIQRQLGLSNLDVGHTISQSMGIIAGRLIESKKISGAVLTGGEIAGATCKVLNGQGIRVIGEVEAGIPYGELIGGVFDGMLLVTKAGAFGTEQALSKALQTLVNVNASRS
ncbi:four-carbon acid sugar kinase family protein [Fictibacillus enclensis]|uniref:four-carbon acid sugar kinase family protein n=1 Tax=Fictibacillus enclensis TaxID=1017270 RepID=UPI0025A1485F|nr:four-carbon acid sugar kinase family protein [Fictibacillus enclensis]MDM5338594.1 four-carbon acid sugar kinase family protein [Fictibacillus enclensis]